MLFSIYFQEMRIPISTNLNFYWMDLSVRQHPTSMMILQTLFGDLEIILRIKRGNTILREIVTSPNKAWDYLIPAYTAPKISKLPISLCFNRTCLEMFLTRKPTVGLITVEQIGQQNISNDHYRKVGLSFQINNLSSWPFFKANFNCDRTITVVPLCITWQTSRKNAFFFRE